jgi:hypothetical protein
MYSVGNSVGGLVMAKSKKTSEAESNGRKAIATELGKLGAAKGGRARAAVLSKEERSEIARNAVKTRWKKAGKLKAVENEASTAEDTFEDEASTPTMQGPVQLPRSLFRGRMTIGDVEIECHVLNNLKRVLAQREVVRILSAGREGGNLTPYLERNPLIDKDLVLGMTERFEVPGGFVGIGYEATLLIEICEKYLEAREQELLRKSQLGLAAQAEIIVRACAKVGIIALIDEATGFQKYRQERELQFKLQAFIADDMQEWARMFPEEFWYELARLEGIRYSAHNRPLRWGKYVMMFVYDAIDPDVGNELRKKNPDPHFLQNHHQWLKKFGRSKVRDQIMQVIPIMKLCSDIKEFKQKFNFVFKNSPLQLSFDESWLLEPEAAV